MTMAAAIEDRTADANAWSTASRIDSIDIVRDIAAAEAVWRSLQCAQTSYTPYQRVDFLKSWQANVGAHEGLSPFIVIAFDADRRPLLLLPLTLRNAYGARCAGFMGGTHARSYAQLPGVKVVAVSSRNLEKAAKLAAEVGAVTSRISANEAERLAFWAGRKNAFPAVGPVP